MDKSERSTYRRGARVVVPVVIVSIVYFAVRLWMLTRPVDVRVTLDFDATAKSVSEDLQRAADQCEEAGWDAPECAWLVHLTHPVEAGAE